MREAVLINPELWASSRAGARAGRGFRFQDAAGAWLAARIWAGDIDSTALVPEGVDDITLHGGVAEIRVQAKARHDPRGRFTTAEIAAILAKSAGTVDAQALRCGGCRIVILLERPAADIAETGWDGNLAAHPANIALLAPHLSDFLASSSLELNELLGAATVVTITDPLDPCVGLICARRGSTDGVARLVAHRLRHLVGEGADRNYRALADDPAIIGAADVGAIIDAVFALVDPDALFPAVAEGLCEPVSFAPVETAFFYEGVDVAPGHVGAGLVLERPALIDEIAAGLQRQRCTLIAGPSGSGKSAAAWMLAYQYRHAVRWYRLRHAVADQAHLLVQLTRSLEASPERPVGFVLDDVGRDLSGVWEALAAELRHERGVLLLGTIREEDLFLIGNLASTSVARPVLDAGLAERIWATLRAEREVAFLHWREPFERSQGLLLEFSHLLTSGKRLQETLNAQMRRRLAEARDDELAILQAVIPAARFGGTIDAERLRTRLSLSSATFARAVARLVDEHAVRIGDDGSLGGLHQIRSAGLYEALSAQLPRAVAVELSEMADILCTEDFARVLPQLLRAMPDIDEALVDALAGRASALAPAELAAVFHGLGLAVCDRIAASWTNIVEENGLDPRHASLAFSLGLTGTKFGMPQFAKIDAASGRIAEVEQRDLRTVLLERMGGLPDAIDATLDEYHELAASLVPTPLMRPAPHFTALPAGDWGEVPLEQGLAVAATVREFGVELAERLLQLFGGSDHLLSRLHSEIAWITRPVLKEEDDVLVVSSDLRFMGDAIHADANGDVVAHCERLLAAVPRAEIAVSSMLGWDGNPAGFKDYSLAVKHIRRENLPSPVRVAWNRASLRAIQSRNGATTESGRANALAVAIAELAEMLADAAELYCRGMPTEQRFEQLLAVRALLNSFIQPPSVDSRARSPRDQGDYQIADRAFDFVTSVTKLAQDLAGGIQRPIVASTEAAKLSVEAEELLTADGWRWLEAAPTQALQTLSAILHDLDAIFGDAHAHPDAFRRSRLNAERTSRNRRARIRFASDARDRALSAAEAMTAEIRTALAAHKFEAIVLSKPMDDPTAPYWPRVDYAVLLSVDHLVNYMALAEDFTEVVRQFTKTHRVTIAPVREGFIVAGLAGVLYENFLPIVDFAEKWTAYLPLPLLQERAAAALAEALNVMLQISAVLANLDRELNEEEMAHAQRLIKSIKDRLAVLETLRDTENDVDVDAACVLVGNILGRVKRELDGDPSDRISAEFARMGNGEPTDFTTMVIGYRIGLLERDILAAAANPLPEAGA